LEKVHLQTIDELRAMVKKQQAKEVSAKWNAILFDFDKWWRICLTFDLNGESLIASTDAHP
jgi:hypothetical protein